MSNSIASRFTHLGFTALICTAFAALGCGGRAIETGPDEPEMTAGGSGSSDTTAHAGAPNKGSGGTLPSHPLGTCVPGFDHASEPARSCQWLTKAGQCFDTFDAACACACPTTGNSVCSSAFPDGPNSATRVLCDAT